MKSSTENDLTIITTMIFAFIVGCGAGFIYCDAAHSDDLRSVECAPTIDAVDWRARIDGDAGALMWWCESADGIYEHSRASSTAAASIMRIVGGDRDVMMLIDSGPLRRPVTEADESRLTLLRRSYTPRCIAIDSELFDTDLKSINGRLAIGQQLGCGLKWIGDERYCYAGSAPLFMGHELADRRAYVRCEILKAPAEGWQQ